MLIQAIKTDVLKQGESVVDCIVKHIPQIPEKSIIVITSKIVALEQGRVVDMQSVKDKEELIRQESEKAFHGKYVWLTLKDGVILASAGIDESNANGKYILLPKESFAVAENIRKTLQEKYVLRDLGILITDSRSIPMRSGVIGLALGYAGFCGLRSYKGKPDIFGKILKFSQTNVADSLAATAVYLMGEGNEQQPLALIQESGVEFCETIDTKELFIDIHEDIYASNYSQFL